MIHIVNEAINDRFNKVELYLLQWKWKITSKPFKILFLTIKVTWEKANFIT